MGPRDVRRLCDRQTKQHDCLHDGWWVRPLCAEDVATACRARVSERHQVRVLRAGWSGSSQNKKREKEQVKYVIG
jgi:hypothetical protein